jgi:hypothetical protein
MGNSCNVFCCTYSYVFFTLPSTPSPLAPDEGTYAFLAKWIGESRPADEFPLFGRGLYLSGRTIIIPASILYRVGVHELDAVRLISTIYGLCALILVVSLILKLYKENTEGFFDHRFNRHLIVGLIFLFAFLPSHFIWSNLGLRESATEFWLISTFVALLLILNCRKKITFPTMLFLFGSIVFTFTARPQVGWVLGVSLSLFLLINMKNSNAYFLIPLVLCAVVFGSTWTSGSTGSTWTSGSTGSTGSTGSIIEDTFTPLVNAGELVSQKQKVNQVDAASVIETQSCPREVAGIAAAPPTRFDSYFCIAWRAPYMVSTFLFRPILGFDVTSTWSLFAAIENLFWFSLFVSVVALVIRKRAISFIAPILPALIFFVLYVLGASAYQGNMGTGFRHKSLILWVVLLVIFALAWRKTESPEQNPRNNSQESAV